MPSPDFRELGVIETPLGRPVSQIVSARTGNEPNAIAVEFFGPVEDVGTPSTRSHQVEEPLQVKA